ncbi:MAG: NAD-dependent deacylase [Candidatus Coatesbacteria bacterium]|nr:NAD-dependent deacylase [Candidatus Coatesbacteria bacterium]
MKKAAELLQKAKYAIALTGAGISVESGIPAFRGKGGLWESYPVEEYATIDAFIANPRKVWNFFRDLYDTLGSAEPNPAHFALAKLESRGILKSVVTQNIDGLHQKAGSREVIEFHGNASSLRCLNCEMVIPFEECEAMSAEIPVCSCGGLLKPEIVLYGESIPVDSLMDAQDEALLCDLMLVIGTSAQVVPASMLPLIARQRHATIIEMNLGQTWLTEHYADISVFGSVGSTLPEVAHLILGDYIDT